jgi:hypothetical protein
LNSLPGARHSSAALLMLFWTAGLSAEEVERLKRDGII